MTTTKTVQEDIATRIETIRSQLDEAIAAEATAAQVRDNLAALNVLGETSSPNDLATAQGALSQAQGHTSALRSALSVLGQRQTAQEAQEEQARISRLREEAKVAAGAEAKALLSVAQSSEKLASALEVVRAQGKILSALHQSLVEANPETAASLEQDRRDAFARLGTIFTANKAEIKQAAASGTYRAQAPSDGTDPALAGDLVLLGQIVVEAGTRLSAVRSAVLSWEASSLERLDAEMSEAQQEAYQKHTARVETGLGAHLPAALSEIKSASALDVDALALLIPEQTARDLARLGNFLPASANDGIGVRTIIRDPLLARQSEAKLQAGLAALRGLAGR